jgi:hypothetical protein
MKRNESLGWGAAVQRFRAFDINGQRAGTQVTQ